MVLPILASHSTTGSTPSRLAEFVLDTYQFGAYHHRQTVCVSVCVLSSHFFWTSGLWRYQPGSHRRKVTQEEGHTGGRSHRISPPSFCGACLDFYREKDSAIPFPLVGREVEFCVIVLHLLDLFFSVSK